MKEVFKRIRREGGHIGRAPYGFSVIRDQQGRRKLARNPSEQKVITKLRSIYKQTTSGKGTAMQLNNKGITRRGRRWNASQVLKNIEGDISSRKMTRDLRDALPQIPDNEDKMEVEDLIQFD